MVTTRPPKTIVKPTALGPVANTDTKLLIYGLFQKGRDLVQGARPSPSSSIIIMESATIKGLATRKLPNIVNLDTTLGWHLRLVAKKFDSLCSAKS